LLAQRTQTTERSPTTDSRSLGISIDPTKWSFYPFPDRLSAGNFGFEARTAGDGSLAREEMATELTGGSVDLDQQRGLRQEIRSEWVTLGPLGRTVFIALALAAVAAAALAIAIPRQVEQYLIEGEIRTITRISGDLAAAGLIPPDQADAAALEQLDEAIKLRLLGSDVVRVKVWSREGVITYSDVSELIGTRYPLSDDRIAAFQGIPSVELVDVERPENVFETELPPLREFYIPVASDDGEVSAVFEIYHLTDHIDSTVGDVRTYVWISVGIAIGLLGFFIAILIFANGRAITRRRVLTEHLFAGLVRSQADERTRVIGALHDDIGQSLYRVHFGLEDLKSRVDAADPQIADELDRLGAIVSNIDHALRAELRLLQYGTGEEVALATALDELAEATEMESNLDVTVHVDEDTGLSATKRVALFRAAREAITNVRKHADAESVQILVNRRGRTVRLNIVDDGVGIGDGEGLGLTTTRERLEAVGGGLRVREERRGGTHFEAWVPVGD